MAQGHLRRLAGPCATTALAVALLQSIATVWFSSEITPLPPNDEVAAPPLTPRVVLIVIDGLRYDTALEQGIMPHLMELGSAGAHGVSLASQVTMTGLGVRTLGTGTMPALADILLETQLPRVAFDNVFASLRRRGDHIAWFGNSAWKELFGDSIDLDQKIDRELELMARADNVWAADRVIVRRAVRMMARDDWQLFVVHLGGLDNASHRYTPFGASFEAKARAVDADIEELVRAAGPRSTVIITSDHGTSDRGHHGSGEPITRRTPLVFTGAAVAHGRVLAAQQTDIAPTIAALLGLPIPAPVEGVVVLDALEVDPTVAANLRQASLRQQRRYADAYAREHGLEPPTIDDTPAGSRRLSAWLEEARTTAVFVPAIWAACLALIGLALFATPHVSAFAILAPVGWSVASGGHSLAAALVALAIAGHAAYAAFRDYPRPTTRLYSGLVAIGLLELSLAIWKLNHRLVEMRMHDLYDLVRIPDHTFALVCALIAAAGGSMVLRRWPVAPWATLGVMVVAASLADTLAIPAAIAFGGAAIGAAPSRRQAIAVALAAVAGVASIELGDAGAFDRVPLHLIAPLGLAAAGWWLGPSTRLGRAALVVCGLAAVVVAARGNPPVVYRVTLVALLAGSWLLAKRAVEQRPLALIGWACAIVLTMLSRPSQLPGVVAWTLFAALFGRALRGARAPDRAVFAATLAVIAFRFSCFALFEGEFEFSHLEVWLAYQGNPGTAVAFGAAVIATKFALPLSIGLALVTVEVSAAQRRQVFAWTVAFLCLRLAHIAIGMTIAKGTFYSPYRDSGQLVFTYLMLASVPIAVAAFASVGAWRAPTGTPGRSARAAVNAPR
jgi:hypothetical protein